MSLSKFVMGWLLLLGMIGYVICLSLARVGKQTYRTMANQ